MALTLAIVVAVCAVAGCDGQAGAPTGSDARLGLTSTTLDGASFDLASY